MQLPTKYGELFQWFNFSDKPDEKGSYISGLKDNVPEEIKILYEEYLKIIKDRE